MSTFTKFLNLFKWNPETDPDEEFDIEKALNENWEKIDTKLEDYIDEVDTRFENYTDEINAEIENFEQNSFATVEMTNRYIGDAYDSTRNYKVGDLCIHNNTLYKCITAITVPENFNVDKWKVTNLSDETELLQQAKVPVGGAKGQILAKKTDTTNDTEWVNGVSVVDNLNSTSETDALSAKQGRLLGTYSTDNEVQVGHWIDGKPIYRKVFNVGLLGNTRRDNYFNFADGIYKNIIKVDGFLYKTNGSCTTQQYNSDGSYLLFHAETTSTGTLMLMVNRSSAEFWADWYVSFIVEYTKTTD